MKLKDLTSEEIEKNLAVNLIEKNFKAEKNFISREEFYYLDELKKIRFKFDLEKFDFEILKKNLNLILKNLKLKKRITVDNFDLKLLIY